MVLPHTIAWTPLGSKLLPPPLFNGALHPRVVTYRINPFIEPNRIFKFETEGGEPCQYRDPRDASLLHLICKSRIFEHSELSLYIFLQTLISGSIHAHLEFGRIRQLPLYEMSVGHLFHDNCQSRYSDYAFTTSACHYRV
jgi:hypothetical protein